MATVDEPTVVLGTEQSACESCGSPLAPDQRYCVVCGTRRGPSSLPDAMRGASASRPKRSTPPPRHRGTSPALTILAFVGALLLALGVGILIGRLSDSTPKPQQVHVTLTPDGTSGGSASAPTTTAAQTSATQSAVATSSAATSSAPAAAGGSGHGASVTATKATVSATHSTASSSSKTKPGYNSKGQFTGNFFGG